MKRALWVAVVLALHGGTAEATVAIGNGNYFIGFTDLEHDAPLNTFQLKVQRTYNSRSQYDGAFGFGWGSDFEGYLAPPCGDGGVVIQENGGGDKTRFSPKEFSEAQVKAGIDKIADAWLKANPGQGSRVNAFKEKIRDSANDRDEACRSLGVATELPEGTLLFSTQRGSKQAVKVIKGGFVRQYSDGKQEFFTLKTNVVDQGVDPTKRRVLKGVYKMTRLLDPVKKAQLTYTYDASGRLATLLDGKSQKLTFQYSPEGKITTVSDSRGRKASYRYCAAGGSAYNSKEKCNRGNLVWSQDTSGAQYTYQYDQLHNLTRIGYPQGKAEEMAYWGPEGLGGVKSVKDTSGTLREYKYWQNPKNKDEHYSTTVKTTWASGRTSEANYEYEEKRRSDGSRYRYKLTTKVDGEETTTIYNECCGQPVQITASSGVTRFEYYPGSGLPKEKDSPAENIQWEYHPKFHGKITKVTVSDKSSKKASSSEFSYDEEKGHLVKAKTSDGRGIVLQYDKESRIATMVDQDRRKITFRYDRSNKPAEILQEGVGSISVIYDKDGNVQDVKSKGGREIAVSVATAFQNLIDIIKPAGIQPI